MTRHSSDLRILAAGGRHAKSREAFSCRDFLSPSLDKEIRDGSFQLL